MSTETVTPRAVVWGAEAPSILALPTQQNKMMAVVDKLAGTARIG